MRKLTIFATVATTVGFILACSGIPTASYENQAACKKWVEAQNKLRCIPKGAKLKADDICPATLDQTPLDMTSYYECMGENAKCKGKVPDLGGQGDCKMPSL